MKFLLKKLTLKKICLLVMIFLHQKELLSSLLATLLSQIDVRSSVHDTSFLDF